MQNNLQYPLRKNLRLKHFDYRNSGNYFITVCTHNRECLLSSIKDNISILTPIGEIVNKFWLSIPDHFQKASIDSYIVMPNHFHGVIYLESSDEMMDAWKQDKEKGLLKGSIGSIIGSWKSVSTKHVNQLANTPGAELWQRNYHQRIIRNDKELEMARTYIENNPFNWEKDLPFVSEKSVNI